MNRGGGGAPPAKKSRTQEEDMDEMDELIEMEEDMMNDGGGQDIPVEVEETIESQELWNMVKVRRRKYISNR